MTGKFSKFAVLLLGAAVLSGCASGRTTAELPQSQLALAPSNARIAVYRTGIMGAAVQPKVKVNGRKTGACQPNAVFYVDVPPGTYEVSASTESTETIFVDAKAGQTHYVECSIGFGVLVGRPNLVEVTSGTGRGKTRDLVFKGKY